MAKVIVNDRSCPTCMSVASIRIEIKKNETKIKKCKFCYNNHLLNDNGDLIKI